MPRQGRTTVLRIAPLDWHLYPCGMIRPSHPFHILPLAQDFEDLSGRFSWNIPPGFNMGEACVTRWAHETPQAPAVIDLNGARRQWTFAQVERAAACLASVLAARGIGQGDRVALYLAQSVEVVIAHVALWKLGAISLPLFTLFGPEALAFRLLDSGAALVITAQADVSKIADAGAFETLVVGGGFWEAIKDASPLDAPQVAGAEDPAVMIYTSGTTGAPKGVLHAHRFLLGHLPAIEMHHRGIGAAQDVGWTPADWAWIGGLMDLAMPCLFYGRPIVACRLPKFTAQGAYEVLCGEQVTRSFLPPTAIRLFQNAPVPDGVGLRSVSSGGEPVTEAMVKWGQAAWGAQLSELYGQTECNLVVSSARDLGVGKAGAMGRAVPGVRLRVLDAAGAPVAPGEIGEIAVHRATPAMFLRYWNQPEKTADKFHNGWMRTGDLGTCDAHGYVTYVARDDDVINVAGYRVGPGEIEACLAAHPEVVMAAVVGVPDAKKGQAVAAYVVLDASAGPKIEARLQDHVRQQLSPHLVPREVTVLQQMPLTATGKVLRRALRDAGGVG